MESNKPPTVKTTRTPYEPPRLVVYGDMRELTQNVGKTGVPDGGHGAHSRTV
jgi:hypothetical protein